MPWFAKDAQYAGLVSNALLKASFTAMLSDAETIVSVTQFGLHRISAAAGGGRGAKMANTVAKSVKSGDKWLQQLVEDIFDPGKQLLLARSIMDNVGH